MPVTALLAAAVAQLKTATAATALTVAAGGVALGGVGVASVKDQPAPAQTPAVLAAAPEAATAGEAESASAPACPEDVRNHGAYVSSVARAKDPAAGAPHGHTVSAAARSDCGKPGKADDAATAEKAEKRALKDAAKAEKRALKEAAKAERKAEQAERKAARAAERAERSSAKEAAKAADKEARAAAKSDRAAAKGNDAADAD